MKSKHKSFYLIVIPAVLIVLAIAIAFMNRGGTSAPAGMREIKSYNPHGLCHALMPECGICPGKVTDEKCYVAKGTYKQYE